MKCARGLSLLPRRKVHRMPEVVSDIQMLRERLREVRRSGATIGLVPTMGALHAGHAVLLEVAHRDCDFVVASIFVNPLQFDRKDDLDKYPRTLDADIRVCESAGTDLIFAPSAGNLYPNEQLTFVDVPKLGEYLCGQFRPGHFRGVSTVVAKLFNIVQPGRAYFGQKDAQQLAIIKRMVADLNFPLTIVPVPTVREADGLALSSRNKHLSPEQRAIAPVLSQALNKAVEQIEKGERAAAKIRKQISPLFEQHPAARVEYFEFVDPETLMPVAQISGPTLIAGAIWLGSTRLIDNVTVTS